MAGGIGSKEIATRRPVTSGLGLSDKHEGRVINLVAQEGSIYPKRLLVGL